MDPAVPKHNESLLISSEGGMFRAFIDQNLQLLQQSRCLSQYN